MNVYLRLERETPQILIQDHHSFNNIDITIEKDEILVEWEGAAAEEKDYMECRFTIKTDTLLELINEVRSK